MADKSLFDIAKELYQGFGNNPANRELANTLTLRAPVVRELNPLVTVPRGIETLRDTDYGAIKDFLTGKYQIANDPRASLQRAGQATMNLGEGALDAAPVLGLVKPAIAGAKAAAPYVTEAAVNKMIGLEQKYGLPTSPTMNIVKPEGNLNLTTRLDEQIRGPETQTVFDLLKQVQGKPGVTKEGLKQIAAKYPDSAAKVTKQEFAESIPPSYYRKEDLATNNEELFDNYLVEAMDHMDYSDTFFNLGLPKRYHDDFDNVISGHTEFSDLDPHTQDILKLKFGLGDDVSDKEAFSTLGQHYMDQRHEEAYDYAMERAGGSYENGYSYKDFQRLVPEAEGENYFEFGVTHPEQAGKKYKHYPGESMPEGLIGHVRGSHLDAPTKIQGGVKTKPNSYIIEEIQSDAQKGSEQVGPLHQVHGTLLKSAVQDAAERGADHVYVPTSYPISDTRGLSIPEDYAAIYDQAVVKEGLEPLRKIPGIEINMVQGKHTKRNLDVVDAPYYYEITMTPEAKEYILTGPGQQVPGYAAGGLVANDYDEEQIDRMSDEIFNFGLGGFVKAAGKAAGKMLAESAEKKAAERLPIKSTRGQEYEPDFSRVKQKTLKKPIDVAHATNDEIPVMSTVKDRLIPNSISTNTGGPNYVYGKNAFKMQLPAGSKVGEIRNIFDLLPEGVEDTPINIGTALRDYAATNELDALYIRNVPGTAGEGEWAIFNNDIVTGAKPYAKGGKVSAEPRENEYVTKAARYGRKGQYQMANLIGIKPEVEFATVIPERYYPANEQHNARGDAMRHMLLQAQLMQKYGETPAKIIGWMHENLSGPQGDAEKAMDEYNDRLGREIGRVAKDKADMAYRAMQAIDKKQAKTLSLKEMAEGYAVGGPVQSGFAAPGSRNALLAERVARGKAVVDAYQKAQLAPGQSSRFAAPGSRNALLAERVAKARAKIDAERQARLAPAPVNQGIVAPTTALAAQQPMYTPHEGMLFGNDFYDRYAQNVGGQFKDPYQNFLMTQGRVTGPDADIANLYKQYQASGRTDTPDWAMLDTKGPISQLPRLAQNWNASGATPVTQLSSAWSPTTPLAEGVTVPEGYWDARLAYNMNLSKAHPDLFKPEDYASGRVSDYNDTALFALRNNIYDINDPRVAAYEMQKAAAQQRKGALGSMEVNALHAAYNDYMRGQQSNNSMPRGYAEGGLVYNDEEINNLADQLLGA